jgi:hypothetical protein
VGCICRHESEAQRNGRCPISVGFPTTSKSDVDGSGGGKLAAKIKEMGYFPLKAAEGRPIYKEKLQADKDLNSEQTHLQDKLKKKNRQRHFHDVDIAIFDQLLIKFNFNYPPPNIFLNSETTSKVLSSYFHYLP